MVATLVLYLFYAAIEAAWLLVAYLLGRPDARQRVRANWWIFVIVPLYRIMVFWFRLSGFLHAAAQPGTWRVQGPIAQSVAGRRVRSRKRAARSRNSSSG